MNKPLSILLGLLVIFAGCKNPPPPEPVPIGMNEAYWVLNEGNFNWGNASLTVFRPGDETIQQAFELVNEIPLGDVAQSMVMVDTVIYIVVNNSGVVHKVHAFTGELLGQMDQLESPRYLLPVSAEKAYLSDLYADAIHVIDLSSLTKTGEIPVGGWTEEMILLNGEAWVAQAGTDQVLVIDVASDLLLDSIQVGREPNGIVEDANGKVWALCSGGLDTTILPELVRIDPATRQVKARFSFSDGSQLPDRLRIDPSGNHLYFINGDVFQMEIGDTTLPSLPFVAAEQRNFYHLKVEESAIWVTNARDFVQNGEVTRYDPDTGNEVYTFPAGAIPGSILYNP